MTQPLKRATIITDASYCHSTKVAGYGAWISMDGKRVQKSGVIKGLPDNSTEAEFKAVLNGIWIAYMHGARDLLVQTDCMTVVQVLRGEPHRRQARYREELSAARAAHFPNCVIRARHVKGHSDSQDARSFVNRWCDKHAGIAMRAARKMVRRKHEMTAKEYNHTPPVLNSTRDFNPAAGHKRHG